MTLSSTNQHLTHQQICDLLLAADPTNELSSFAEGGGPASDHLRQCLTCTSELESLRSSVASFQAASTAVTQHELARRPLSPPFASLTPSRSRGYAIPGLVWATAALVVAAALPFGLTHNFNPILGSKPDTVATTQPAPAVSTSTPSSNVSDEALLEDINQDLSASIPSALQPLAGTTSTQTSQGSN